MKSKTGDHAIDKMISDYKIEHGSFIINPTLYIESSEYDSQRRKNKNKHAYKKYKFR